MKCFLLLLSLLISSPPLITASYASKKTRLTPTTQHLNISQKTQDLPQKKIQKYLKNTFNASKYITFLAGTLLTIRHINNAPFASSQRNYLLLLTPCFLVCKILQIITHRAPKYTYKPHPPPPYQNFLLSMNYVSIMTLLYLPGTLIQGSMEPNTTISLRQAFIQSFLFTSIPVAIASTHANLKETLCQPYKKYLKRFTKFFLLVFPIAVSYAVMLHSLRAKQPIHTQLFTISSMVEILEDQC